MRNSYTKLSTAASPAWQTPGSSSVIIIAPCFSSMQWYEPCALSFSEQLLSHKQSPFNLSNPVKLFPQVLAVQGVCDWRPPKHTSIGLFASVLDVPVLTTPIETQYTRAQTSLGLQKHRHKPTWAKSQGIVGWSWPSRMSSCLALTYEWVPLSIHFGRWVIWKQTFLQFQLQRTLFRWTWTRNKNLFFFLPSICTWG